MGLQGFRQRTRNLVLDAPSPQKAPLQPEWRHPKHEGLIGRRPARHNCIDGTMRPSPKTTTEPFLQATTDILSHDCQTKSSWSILTTLCDLVRSSYSCGRLRLHNFKSEPLQQHSSSEEASPWPSTSEICPFFTKYS